MENDRYRLRELPKDFLDRREPAGEQDRGEPAGEQDRGVDPKILEIIQSLGRDDKKNLENIRDPKIFIKINGLEGDGQSNREKANKGEGAPSLTVAFDEYCKLPPGSPEAARWAAYIVATFATAEDKLATERAFKSYPFQKRLNTQKIDYRTIIDKPPIRAKMPLSELLSKREPTLPKLRRPKLTLDTIPPRRKHQDGPDFLALLRKEIERLAAGSVTKSTIDAAPELDTKRLKELLTVVPSPDLRKFEPKIIVKNRLSDSKNFSLRPSHTLSTFTDFDDDVDRFRNNEIRKKEK